MFERLDAEVREALKDAYAPRSKGPLKTALRSLAAFTRRCPKRVLFKRPQFQGDLHADAHNEWTLMCWVQDLGRRKSAKTGKHLKVSTIEQRVSLAKGFLSFKYGFQLVGTAIRLKGFLAKLRGEDPRGGLRKKRRGMRKHHLKKLWREHAAIRSESPAALSEWAAEATAWHVLARGGELEALQKGDLQFRTSGAGRRYAILWLRPLKKRSGPQAPKLPQFIQEQRVPEEWEPYRALRRLTDSMTSEPDTTPLFRASGGKPMTTPRFRAINKKYAALLGWNPKEAGAHGPRIGDATDYAATGSGELLLQAKGRWSSDIARIYARMTRRAHLAASDLMFEAKGRDLEELIPEFAEMA